jgi:hypothetical protein
LRIKNLFSKKNKYIKINLSNKTVDMVSLYIVWKLEEGIKNKITNKTVDDMAFRSLTISPSPKCLSTPRVGLLHGNFHEFLARLLGPNFK